MQKVKNIKAKWQKKQNKTKKQSQIMVIKAGVVFSHVGKSDIEWFSLVGYVI